jgi:hypothetical protein
LATAAATAVTTSGTITDPNGAPAANVRIVSPTPSPLQARGGFRGATQDIRTDEHGRYSITWLPPRGRGRGAGVGPAPVYLVARDPDHNLAGVAKLDSRITNQDLRLTTGLTITGSVVDAGNNTPVAGASVLATNYTGEPAVVFQRETVMANDQGVFTMAGLPQGASVGMRVSGGNGYGSINKILLPPDTATSALQIPAIALKPLNTVLAGVVQYEDGTPVPNAEVIVMGPGLANPYANADSHGRFSVKVSEGPAYVTGVAGGGRSPTLTVQGGDTNVVIQVAATANRGGGAGGNVNNGVAARAGGHLPSDDGAMQLNTLQGAQIVVTGTGQSGGNQSMGSQFDGGGGRIAGAVRATTSSQAFTQVTTTRTSGMATIRVGAVKPAPGTWESVQAWPSEHRNVLVDLAVAQGLLLVFAGGGVFWVTRRRE